MHDFEVRHFFPKLINLILLWCTFPVLNLQWMVYCILCYIQGNWRWWFSHLVCYLCWRLYFYILYLYTQRRICWKPSTIITKRSILDVAAALDPLLGFIFQYYSMSTQLYSFSTTFRIFQYRVECMLVYMLSQIIVRLLKYFRKHYFKFSRSCWNCS